MSLPLKATCAPAGRREEEGGRVERGVDLRKTTPGCCGKEDEKDNGEKVGGENTHGSREERRPAKRATIKENHTRLFRVRWGE